MYAIINKKTKKFMYGTDYRSTKESDYCYSKHRRIHKQRTSFNCAKIYEYAFEAESDLKSRMMSKDYVVCKVNINIEKIINENEIKNIINKELS
jgi:hypothetical protein